jgi:2'-hydroxyisoflavone reductase
MKVLVLGGTRFIGLHVVRALLDAGHSVTLLNRGVTAPDAFPGLPVIRADREAAEFPSLQALRQDWDGVVDLASYYPRSLEKLLPVFSGRTGRYVYCSTVSAYAASSAPEPMPLLVEESPLHSCTEAQALDPSMASYGQRKAECERAVMSAHSAGLPSVILRPSVVFGAHDHTDRMAHWLWRAARAKPFILPDDGLTITRRTYAPDLARAFVSALSAPAAAGGAYNIAEIDALSFRDTLRHLGEHLGTKPLDHAVSVAGERLLKEGIRPWSDLPLWIPRMHLQADTFKSRRDLGFASTPAPRALAEAADAFLGEGREPNAGISASAEEEILKKLSRS